MPSLSTHNTQAKHNERLSKKLSKTEFIDWSIICAFYATLHYVEAKLTSIPEIEHTEKWYYLNRPKMSSFDAKLTIHLARENLIGIYFPKIRSKYHHLMISSETARYLTGTMDKPAFIFFDEPLLQQFLQDLETIKKELQN